MTPEARARALALAERGAELTATMTRLEEEHAAMAMARAMVWREAIDLGMTRTELAEAAGVHHSRVGKAIERRGSASAA